MKKSNLLIIVATALVLSVMVFKTTNAEESKSVAWYVANIREAKTKIQECHDNTSLQSSPECANARHALEISFGVASQK